MFCLQGLNIYSAELFYSCICHNMHNQCFADTLSLNILGYHKMGYVPDLSFFTKGCPVETMKKADNSIFYYSNEDMGQPMIAQTVLFKKQGVLF